MINLGDIEKFNPADIQKYLSGVKFPASKDDLVKFAQNNKAPEDMLGKIKQFPNQQFGSAEEVIKTLGKI